MQRHHTALVTIEPELFDDRCRVTVTRRGKRGTWEKDVYTDLTAAEVIDVLEAAGITVTT